MVVSYLLIGPSLILTSLFGHDNLTLWLCILIGSACLGFAAGMMVIPILPLMNKIGRARYAGDSTDAIAALFSAMYSVGDAVGPLLGGALGNYFGFEWSCTIWAAALLVSTVFLLAYGCLYEIKTIRQS